MRDDSCIFCKIIYGEIPSYKVYEDDHFLAFLDTHPESPGHTQVVTKEHYRWVWDVPNVGEYFEVVKKIALAQQKAFGTDFILSKIIGDEVHHAHIWVYSNSEVKGDKKDLADNAEKLRKKIK